MTEYTYRITTLRPETKITFWRGGKRTTHGTLKKAIATYRANVPFGIDVQVERAPIGEYQPFDMRDYLEDNDVQ